jgi:uncharacterized protein (TIGR03435 family)
MTSHLWQSTVFALAGGVFTLLLRKNRAEVRYWIWLSASLKFFIPLSILIGLGSRVHWTHSAPIATPTVTQAIEQIVEPASDIVAFAVSKPKSHDWIPVVLELTWALGFIAIALIRYRGWLRIRAALEASSPLDFAAPVEIRSAPGLLEPGVVGLFRPVLLVPEGILDRLTSSQWDAVLAHELCHIRRRDNLFASIHMVVEALFWFHPLVWWIGARLVEERERACDEEVLKTSGTPDVYAEAILNVCKLYTESPLASMSGVTGADLKKRIETIMSNRFALQLSTAKKIAIACTAVAALIVPIAVGILKAQIAAPVPQFEVASIRSCSGAGGGGGRDGGRKGGGGGGQALSPDRLTLACQPVRNLIRMAYNDFADGRFHPANRTLIEGGLAWIDSERYQITAKAVGTPGQSVMRGPMLQALLEERFKAKVHRESRQVPVYAITVAKNGPKLKPFKEGTCSTFEFGALPEGGRIFCELRSLKVPKPDAPVVWDVFGASLAGFARALSIDMDRIVIDKTGIEGKFDFHMEFTPDQSTTGLNSMRGPNGPLFTPSDPTGGPSVFTAIQEQLGLKLEATKGPREFIVVDHVEKPTEN